MTAPKRYPPELRERAELLTSSEREELQALRGEVNDLCRANEIDPARRR